MSGGRLKGALRGAWRQGKLHGNQASRGLWAGKTPKKLSGKRLPLDPAPQQLIRPSVHPLTVWIVSGKVSRVGGGCLSGPPLGLDTLRQISVLAGQGRPKIQDY